MSSAPLTNVHDSNQTHTSAQAPISQNCHEKKTHFLPFALIFTVSVLQYADDVHLFTIFTFKKKKSFLVLLPRENKVYDAVSWTVNMKRLKPRGTDVKFQNLSNVNYVQSYRLSTVFTWGSAKEHKNNSV